MKYNINIGKEEVYEGERYIIIDYKISSKIKIRYFYMRFRDSNTFDLYCIIHVKGKNIHNDYGYAKFDKMGNNTWDKNYYIEGEEVRRKEYLKWQYENSIISAATFMKELLTLKDSIRID